VVNIEDWFTEKIISSNIKVLSICGAADLGKSYIANRVVEKLRHKGLGAFISALILICYLKKSA
jgi:molybdopterin-guanine dinucleotide biosynthesis protein